MMSQYARVSNEEYLKNKMIKRNTGGESLYKQSLRKRATGHKLYMVNLKEDSLASSERGDDETDSYSIGSSGNNKFMSLEKFTMIGKMNTTTDIAKQSMINLDRNVSSKNSIGSDISIKRKGSISDSSVDEEHHLGITVLSH